MPCLAQAVAMAYIVSVRKRYRLRIFTETHSPES